jgi:hypothetical protein
LPLDRFPLEKVVHRHDAAPLAVGVSERWEPVNGLALGIGRRIVPVESDFPSI